MRTETELVASSLPDARLRTDAAGARYGWNPAGWASFPAVVAQLGEVIREVGAQGVGPSSSSSRTRGSPVPRPGHDGDVLAPCAEFASRPDDGRPLLGVD
ncbi:hypothetical protein [Streptomyces sp. NPDC051109]|uniref:hypothetical protein n=1 Tax=Streptomyces sp. NPDC051109 TaxID=3365642 RepID=UPI0010660B5D